MLQSHNPKSRRPAEVLDMQPDFLPALLRHHRYSSAVYDSEFTISLPPISALTEPNERSNVEDPDVVEADFWRDLRPTDGPSVDTMHISAAELEPSTTASQDGNPTDVDMDEDKSKTCLNCSTQKSIIWRCGPEGQDLCNACGLFLEVHGIPRPLSLKRDVAIKRQKPRVQAPKQKPVAEDDRPTWKSFIDRLEKRRQQRMRIRSAVLKIESENPLAAHAKLEEGEQEIAINGLPENTRSSSPQTDLGDGSV